MKYEIQDKQIDVVAIGAHPDDVDITVGGTLAKLAKQKISTAIIDLTHGEPTPSNELYIALSNFDPDYAKIRISEVQMSKKYSD